MRIEAAPAVFLLLTLCACIPGMTREEAIAAYKQCTEAGMEAKEVIDIEFDLVNIVCLPPKKEKP